jgi:hypothetical protein
MNNRRKVFNRLARRMKTPPVSMNRNALRDAGGGQTMRIGGKIGLGFCAVLALTGVVAATAWNALSDYSSRVEFSSKTRDLAEDLSAVRLDRAAFSASGAPDRAEAVSTGLADLSGRTVALRDTADGARAERLDAMVEQLGDYAVAFDALLAAHHGRIDNAAEMQARADELAGLAERIATDQAARYAQARDRMGALNGDLDASLEVSRLAESLDRLATAAGAGQADYLLTGAQEDADCAAPSPAPNRSRRPPRSPRRRRPIARRSSRCWRRSTRKPWPRTAPHRRPTRSARWPAGSSD